MTVGGILLRTCYTRSAAKADTWLSRHVSAATLCLGLDVESCANHGFDVLQLATASGEVLVYQINAAAGSQGTGAAPTLLMRRTLQNAALVKAGVGVHADARRIFQQWHVRVKGCVDLAILVNRSGPGKSLEALASQHVGLLPWKHLRRHKGRWWHRLSVQQQAYAAMDAYAGVAVYEALVDVHAIGE